MATFEEVGLAFQIIHNIFGLILDIRRNAGDYGSRLSAGMSVADVASIMVEDANQYLRRVGWITALATRNLTLFDNCLSRLGLTRADAISLRTSVQLVANHTKQATLTSAAEINSESAYILGNVPNFERLF